MPGRAGTKRWRNGFHSKPWRLAAPTLTHKHGLADQLFKAVNRHLHDQGLELSQGTIVDATILAASSSTTIRNGAAHGGQFS